MIKIKVRAKFTVRVLMHFIKHIKTWKIIDNYDTGYLRLPLHLNGLLAVVQSPLELQWTIDRII